MNKSIDHKEKEVNKGKKNGKSKQNYSVRNLIVFALLLFSGFILFNVEKLPDFTNNFYKDKVDNINSVEENEILKNPETVQAALDEPYYPGPDPEVEELAPEQSDELKPDPLLSKPLKDGNQDEESKKDVRLNALNDYRLYLANANKMILNFNQNKTYSIELANFRKHDSPERVERILRLLDLYNNYLIEMNTQNADMDLNSKILNKFVKIKKVSENTLIKNKLREEIIHKLDILFEYIFSIDLQKSFVEK